mmetsp:Transcript_27817/g.95722  ORF Transcript_27817/g.95722 Transcript_27817/m.95722 type:complete len:225 (+) Transcript_27817:526-1200(+)
MEGAAPVDALPDEVARRRKGGGQGRRRGAAQGQPSGADGIVSRDLLQHHLAARRDGGPLAPRGAGGAPRFAVPGGRLLPRRRGLPPPRAHTRRRTLRLRLRFARGKRARRARAPPRLAQRRQRHGARPRAALPPRPAVARPPRALRRTRRPLRRGARRELGRRDVPLDQVRLGGARLDFAADVGDGRGPPPLWLARGDVLLRRRARLRCARTHAARAEAPFSLR